MFFKKTAVKDCLKLTGKHLCWSLFLINLQAKACNFNKKRLQYRCFSVNFAKFLRISFIANLRVQFQVLSYSKSSKTLSQKVFWVFRFVKCILYLFFLAVYLAAPFTCYEFFSNNSSFIDNEDSHLHEKRQEIYLFHNTCVLLVIIPSFWIYFQGIVFNRNKRYTWTSTPWSIDVAFPGLFKENARNGCRQATFCKGIINGRNQIKF